MSGADQQGQPPVTFTLDGVEHTSPVRRMTAGEVLQNFGGLNPADYDLIRIEGQGHEQRYMATDQIELLPGGRYVSLFTGPMPVE
jgi:hypothetical protein